jgi:hypothetical protein
MIFLEGREAADTNSKDATDSVRIPTSSAELRIIPSLLRCADSKLREKIVFLDLFALKIGYRIKAFDLSGDLR